MRFHSDRRYHLPMSPDELWATVARVDDYQSWWPWLRRFEGEHLADQAVWTCLVQPPLPYWVRFDVVLDEVIEPHTVRARIKGDVVGDAHLDIREHLAGSEARLISNLGPGNPLLKAVAAVAAPVVRYGHDWVLDSGVRQFLDRHR
ncbi:MAG: hypothetical protein WD691_00510 [Acidimicrobiales bacterium]